MCLYTADEVDHDWHYSRPAMASVSMYEDPSPQGEVTVHAPGDEYMGRLCHPDITNVPQCDRTLHLSHHIHVSNTKTGETVTHENIATFKARGFRLTRLCNYAVIT